MRNIAYTRQFFSALCLLFCFCIFYTCFFCLHYPLQKNHKIPDNQMFLYAFLFFIHQVGGFPFTKLAVFRSPSWRYIKRFIELMFNLWRS